MMDTNKGRDGIGDIPAAWIVRYGDSSVGSATDAEEAEEMIAEAKSGASAAPLYEGTRPNAADQFAEVERLARIIGDNFSPNQTFDRSSLMTQLACRRAAVAVLAELELPTL